MALCSAHEVAAHIILAVRRDRNENVTNLKLQKLVYYSQAFYLALYDEPLFDDPIEAWVHGPVVPVVFAEYRHYRWHPIDGEIASPGLGSEITDHITEVLEAYGHLSATALERLTKRQDPWIAARGTLPPDEPSHAEINHESMREFYDKLLVQEAA